MVFQSDQQMPANPLDSSDTFKADVPFDIKQAALGTTRRHRWFQPMVIATTTGPYSGTPGLAAGATQRIQFDRRPDFVIVAISGQTANTGRVMVYSGDPGGPGILLGPTGKLTMPANQDGIVTLVNVGSTATFGTVLAVAGYGSPGIDISPGS